MWLVTVDWPIFEAITGPYCSLAKPRDNYEVLAWMSEIRRRENPTGKLSRELEGSGNEEVKTSSLQTPASRPVPLSDTRSLPPSWQHDPAGIEQFAATRAGLRALLAGQLPFGMLGNRNNGYTGDAGRKNGAIEHRAWSCPPGGPNHHKRLHNACT